MLSADFRRRAKECFKELKESEESGTPTACRFCDWLGWSAAVGAPPDLLGLRRGDQFLPEVRVGDGDQPFRPLPGAPARQIHAAVLRDQVVGLAPGIGDDVPLEMGDDPGAADAVFAHKGGRHTDEGLAAPGHGRAGEIVQLAAGAADLPQSSALGAHLTIEIRGDAAVDGDHVVQLGDGLRGVDVLQRGGHDARVLIHPVIEGLGAEDDARDALVFVDGLPGVGQLARPEQLIVGVAAQLCVHTQVLEV